MLGALNYLVLHSSRPLSLLLSERMGHFPRGNQTQSDYNIAVHAVMQCTSTSLL